MIAVAPPPRTAISGAIPQGVPAAADRPTPKVAIDTRDSDEGDDSDWVDAETAPGVTSGSR
jgi:hypothetical protein